MINLTCPCCGHPLFGRTDMAVLERLQATSEPLPASTLTAGLNITRSAWHMSRNRINDKLKGFRIVNVEPAASTARYRLEKLP